MTNYSGASVRGQLAHHPLSIRIAHWVNVIAGAYLLVSGVHLFLDFP